MRILAEWSILEIARAFAAGAGDDEHPADNFKFFFGGINPSMREAHTIYSLLYKQ